MRRLADAAAAPDWGDHGKLAGEPRYGRFFAEAAGEFDELDRKVADFLRRAATSLTLAERLRAAEKEVTFDELVQERREDFANSCRDMFRLLALFLARAVLRSEASETGIVHRLSEIGFDAAEPMNLPRFPIHSLTVLALGIFLYLLVAIVFFDRMPSSGAPRDRRFADSLLEEAGFELLVPQINPARRC